MMRVGGRKGAGNQGCRAAWPGQGVGLVVEDADRLVREFVHVHRRMDEPEGPARARPRLAESLPAVGSGGDRVAPGASPPLLRPGLIHRSTPLRKDVGCTDAA